MTRAAIISAFDPERYKGGIETFILNLKTLLSEKDIDVDLHFTPPEPAKLTIPFPVKCLSKVAPDLLMKCFMTGRAFSKIEKNYDLVISNNFYGLGYFSPQVRSVNIYHSTHAGYADALKGKIPDDEYRSMKYFFGHIGDRLSGRGKLKIAVSKAVNNELQKYYKFVNVHIVHHGVDTFFFKKMGNRSLLRRKWNIDSNALTGIFVSRWEKGKGTDIIEEVVKLHPDITWLFVIGNSECPLSDNNRVRVIQDADKETMRELYSSSDFMLFPSYYEGFGFAVVEAMSCGLPVICTETGVAIELLKSNELRKLILPLTDKADMVNRIGNLIRMLKDATERSKIEAAGREIIERDFTIEIWKAGMSAALGLSPQ